MQSRFRSTVDAPEVCRTGLAKFFLRPSPINRRVSAATHSEFLVLVSAVRFTP